MGKPRDTKYYCNKCKKHFPVRGIVVKQLETFNKKAFCPRCNSDEHTSRYNEVKGQSNRQSTLNDPPTNSQLNYISSLGGTQRPKTKAEAGAMITKLKKLK